MSKLPVRPIVGAAVFLGAIYEFVEASLPIRVIDWLGRFSVVADAMTYVSNHALSGIIHYGLIATLILIGTALLIPSGWWRRMAPLAGHRGGDDFVLIEDAGRWLYDHSSTKIQQVLREGVPSIFETVAAHGAAFYKASAMEGRCQLWGRREAGLKMEPIEPAGADFTAFESVFGTDRRIAVDLSVKRADLPKVLAWYERDEPPALPRHIKRDKDLREGLGWIVFKEWGHTPTSDGDGRLADFSAAWDRVRQAARDEDITIWGKPSNSLNPWEPIDADFWRDHNTDFLRLWYPTDETETRTTKNSPLADGEFVELMVSRAEFEGEWPP